MKRRVFHKTAPFHVEKKCRTVSFKTTLFPFLLPLDVQQGKAIFLLSLLNPTRHMPAKATPHTLS
jgi:hypothetical protein